MEHFSKHFICSRQNSQSVAQRYQEELTTEARNWLFLLLNPKQYLDNKLIASQQTLNVDSTLIYVEITSRHRSMWYPRWFNVDLSTLIRRHISTLKRRWFGLTLKTILFSYHRAWKIKIFLSSLKRWPYFNVEASSVHQRYINVKIWHWNKVDYGLILKNDFVLISYVKLKSSYQRWKDNRIWTSKQSQFINLKSTSKFDVETTLILGWL